jgi:parvulin-like peptidyl-prolyl isomerase
VAGVVVVVVLILLVGVFYDQVWEPRQAIAQVNEENLTQQEFRQELRDTFAQEIVRNLQLVAMFEGNEQIREQFANLSPGINESLKDLQGKRFRELRNGTDQEQALVEQVITSWQEDQLIVQGAADLGIQASEDEVFQQMAYEMGPVVLPALSEPPPTTILTPTDELSPTDELTPTGDLEEIGIIDEETGEGAMAGAVTDLSDLPSPSPFPTATPRPTPEVSTAREQVPNIFDQVFDRYMAELEAARTQLQTGGQTGEPPDIDLSPVFTAADFQRAMEQQYRRTVLRTDIEEHLVPEEEFEASTEPDRVKARHILLAVDTPEGATEEERDAAYAAREDDAEALVEQLRAGADFAELVREHSDDPGSRENGGDVGYFDEEGASSRGGTYDPDFVAAAFALEEGEISDPVRTPFGWHIIEVTERQVSTEEEQLQQARTEAFDEWLEQQREESTVRRFPAPSPTPTVPTATPTLTTEPTYMPGPPTLPPTPIATPAATAVVTATATSTPVLSPTLTPTRTATVEGAETTEPAETAIVTGTETVTLTLTATATSTPVLSPTLTPTRTATGEGAETTEPAETVEAAETAETVETAGVTETATPIATTTSTPSPAAPAGADEPGETDETGEPGEPDEPDEPDESP